MLIRERLLEQLQAKRASFHAFDDDFQHEAESYDQALADLARHPAAYWLDKLGAHNAPGALPTEEFDAARALALPFAQQFQHHDAARAWAHDVLLDHTTLAVDGSQVLPAGELSIPVAAVQVAWFANAHKAAGQYVKDLALEILAPEELRIEYDGERQYSEQVVNFHRFRLEVATLCRLMREAAGARHLPLAFFDSSLVISFAEQLHDQMRAQYLEQVRALLRCSEETRVPVVGYVDASHARDLTRMLAVVFGLGEADRVHDAQLIAPRLAWGARTPFFICARGSSRGIQQSVLERLGEDFSRAIGFVYLKTNAAAPARLEIPRWVYDAGLLEPVVDLVRAEVIVGNGYPYALETADAAAVLNARDRAAFQELFQRFAAQEGLALRIAQKAASKARRR